MIQPGRVPMKDHDCPLSAMVYDDNGARCTGCGMTWPMHRTNEGKPIGYLTPPATPAQRRAANAGWFE